MAATDAMIARLESELEERNAFVEGLVAGAEEAGRDLNSGEMEMIGAAQGRISALADQLDPAAGNVAAVDRVPPPGQGDRPGDPDASQQGRGRPRRVPLRRRLHR